MPREAARPVERSQFRLQKPIRASSLGLRQDATSWASEGSIRSASAGLLPVGDVGWIAGHDRERDVREITCRQIFRFCLRSSPPLSATATRVSRTYGDRVFAGRTRQGFATEPSERVPPLPGLPSGTGQSDRSAAWEEFVRRMLRALGMATVLSHGRVRARSAALRGRSLGLRPANIFAGIFLACGPWQPGRTSAPEPLLVRHVRLWSPPHSWPSSPPLTAACIWNMNSRSV